MSYFSPSGTDVVERKAYSSLLVIDSDDRNNAQSVQNTGNQAEYQPWNNFVIRTPDRLLTGEPKSIRLSSIRFPWAIPNINAQTNKMDIVITPPGGPAQVVQVDLSPDLNQILTPQQIALYITQQTEDSGIVVSYDPTQQQFSFAAQGLVPNSVITFNAYNNVYGGAAPLNPQQYGNLPSLCHLLGLTPSQVFVGKTSSGSALNIVGSFTNCLYTNYVDIASTKLNQYRTIADGSSINQTSRTLITRLYCANETSQSQVVYNDGVASIVPVGTYPFVIHRHFCEKSIRYATSSIGELDFQVYDQYGNLVQLPTQEYFSLDKINKVYPGFQMTFVVGE